MSLGFTRGNRREMATVRELEDGDPNLTPRTKRDSISRKQVGYFLAKPPCSSTQNEGNPDIESSFQNP